MKLLGKTEARLKRKQVRLYSQDYHSIQHSFDGLFVESEIFVRTTIDCKVGRHSLSGAAG